MQIFRLFWLSSWLLLVGTAHAEHVVTLQTQTLPPLERPFSQLLTVEGQPAALAQNVLWVLQADGRSWVPRDFPFKGAPLGVAAGAEQSYLLLGTQEGGAVERVQSLVASAELAPLPAPLYRARGAVLGDTLYLAGRVASGESKLLAIQPLAVLPTWKVLAGWPDPSRELHALVAQTGALWASLGDGGGRPDHLMRWSLKEGWSTRGEVKGSVLHGVARATGQAHLLFLVGEGTEAPRWMTYQTLTGGWAPLTDAPVPGLRAATPWKNGFVWERAGVLGTQTEMGFTEIVSGQRLLAWLDWLVIAVYLFAMLGMGLYFYLREKRTSTSDFFVGGRTIPFWAAGISLYAANTSSISYIAIPAKAFATNWQYLANSIITVGGLIFVAIWIVPLLRRLDLMSVFHYLETRFHPVIRMLASGLFIAVQIGSRLSVILFLPSLAIATMTGISVVVSILIMGVFTLIYTALGGMKAVVWTDFVQLIVKMGGIFFALGFVVYMLHGGVGEFFTVAAADNKMKLFDFRFDLTTATVWGFLFLVVFDVVLTFPKDQVLMQRVLSTPSDKDAGRSIWTFAAIMIPGGFLFYMVGTALFVFYKRFPERMNPLLAIDATFPFFIAAELPRGVRGLIIAGILAAAMATLSSIMNSVATLASVDFYEKWVKQPDPRFSVRFAEAMTVVTGLLGMGIAILLTRYDIQSLFDTSIELAGLLGGGFAGAYTLGMFTRRANWQGVAVGVAASITVTTWAWWLQAVHPYFYLAISIFTCITVGYLASWLFPAPSPESLAGLTIYAEQTKAVLSSPPAPAGFVSPPPG